MDKSEVASVAYRSALGSGSVSSVVSLNEKTDKTVFGFRYRHWKLGDDIDLIVRCEHDGVMTGANGEVSFINVKTLNEWDSRVRGHKAKRFSGFDLQKDD